MLDDKINIMEKSGRNKFKRLCDNLQIYFVEAENPFEYFDGIVYYNGKKFLIEIKDRDEKFNYDTILFETDKYENLKSEIIKNNVNGAYYCSFFNNDAYIYLIPTEMKIKETKIMGNKCTAINNEKKEKYVYFIPKEETKHYSI